MKINWEKDSFALCFKLFLSLEGKLLCVSECFLTPENLENACFSEN